IYSGLTVWNVVTQGKDPVYTSVLLDNFVNNDTIQCSARSINVGDSLLTRPQGQLQWYITDVSIPGQDTSGFIYNGALIQANLTLVSLTHQFTGQTFYYEVCANASVPYLTGMNSTTTDAAGDSSMTISMCADFDLSKDSGPKWAQRAQNNVQNKVFGISSQYFQQLEFPNGTFPLVVFPPYGDAGTSPRDTSITPEKAFDLSVWLDDFIYLPNSTPSTDADFSDFGATHQMIVVGSSSSTTDIGTVFGATAQPGGASGMQLGLNGIGGLMLYTTAINQGLGFTEPALVTQMRDYTLKCLNMILDLASNDLQNRAIDGGYLCTVTTEKWKKPLSLVAMVLGNNSSLFGFILGLFISAAAYREERRSGPGTWSTILHLRHTHFLRFRLDCTGGHADADYTLPRLCV
ncbi:hypothetical protein OE88DRAFT_1634594, partial [Heliocybe sulcata]